MRRLLLIAGMTISCMAASAQQNQRVYDEAAGQEILIGDCTPKAFYEAPFSTWYTPAFEGYTINPEILEQLPARLHLPGLTITVVFGTWCDDSQREVPHFLKILQATKFSTDHLTLIAVNKQKQAPGIDQLLQLNVQRVPTIIVFMENKEIGRIVESPTTTLEEDLNNILEKI
ncbi:MAG TPA: thioredoxin family protein [Williamwhitmania sp.]|nr:thioredoxin family protein [Williamwhitmania sp.]